MGNSDISYSRVHQDEGNEGEVHNKIKYSIYNYN